MSDETRRVRCQLELVVELAPEGCYPDSPTLRDQLIDDLNADPALFWGDQVVDVLVQWVAPDKGAVDEG